MRIRTIAFCLALATVSGHAHAQPASRAPMYVEVYVRGERRDAKVAGKLLEHDDAGVTIEAAGGARTLEWDALTPSSAFTLKSRLIDKTVAADWLALGTFGWEHGLSQQARAALATARKLNPALGPKIDTVLSVDAGSKRFPPETATPATKPADEGEMIDETDAVKPAGGDGPAGGAAQSTRMQRGYERGQKIVRYATPTPAEIAKSLARSRAFADKARAAAEVELVEIETPHFLIFTDWDAREHKFLQDKCEAAYRVVAKQFNLPASDTVFVGKLPVYMFKSQDDFQRFARELDGFGAPRTVLGYFNPADEIGHMAMWKPGIGEGVGAGGSREEAERNWARTLVHEFCHAFIYRYKSNANVPRWINEGTAELISEGELPTNNYRSLARTAALQNVDVSGLFDDANMPSGFYYPVMMTMVECLVRQDQKKFIAMFNDIKDGTEPEAAIEKHYGVGYAKFAEAWKKYARGLK